MMFAVLAGDNETDIAAIESIHGGVGSRALNQESFPKCERNLRATSPPFFAWRYFDAFSQ
jgi:hypothetical protein